MTVTVRDEVEVNGYKYRIKGGVTGGWLDPFPEQFTLGDADYANRRDLSSWIINDLRGGIGVEEMDEKKDWNKCWWTDCIIKFRNHILPPRLATAITAPVATTVPTIVNGGMELETGWDYSAAYVTRSNTQAQGDTYSLKIVTDVGDTTRRTGQYLIGWTPGVTYTFSCYIYVEGNGTARLEVADGTQTQVSGTTTAASWVEKSIAITVASNATYLRLILRVDYATQTENNYFDTASITMDSATGAITYGTPVLATNFNGELYWTLGAVLAKLNSGRTALETLWQFGTTPTALIASLNSRLYIYHGDSTNYDYLTTTFGSDGITETATDLKDLTADASTDADTIVDAALSGKSILKGDYVYNTTRSAGAYVTSYTDGTTTIELESEIASQASGDTYSVRRGANWGFQHDAKLFRVNTLGTVTYSTDPDATSPTWTSAGAITDIAAQIEGFVVGRDAAGNYVPYAATNSIIKAYDSATPQWIDTEARLPNHPIGGQGHAYWNGKLYFSYGLAVKEYYPETGAFLDIGLTERDGLPVEFNGEIVKLLGDTGVKGMFASMDASVTSGNSKSGLYLYDGYSWQCWWKDTSNNGAMHDIIVSSASSGDAIYWDVGGTIYYIDIHRGIENPDKISQNYATSGIFLSSWFDAGNPVAAKLAKVLEDYAKGITTTETVALKYRLDHTNTDLDTGWTTLDTLNTTDESGHNEELFASGAGISFKAIQFRLDFVTPGATAKPDIQSLVLYHKKRTGSEKLRVWNVTVICDNYGLTTAKEKVANLKAAVISTVDVLFSYHPNDDSTESYYVTVNCGEFSEQTGRDYEANYKLTLIES